MRESVHVRRLRRRRSSGVFPSTRWMPWASRASWTSGTPLPGGVFEMRCRVRNSPWENAGRHFEHRQSSLSADAATGADTYRVTYTDNGWQLRSQTAPEHSGTSLTIGDVDSQKTYIAGVWAQTVECMREPCHASRLSRETRLPHREGPISNLVVQGGLSRVRALRESCVWRRYGRRGVALRHQL